MNTYTYEDVKQAYAAIIEVGKSQALFGPFAVDLQHVKNLQTLEGAAKELYEKLLSDETINY